MVKVLLSLPWNAGVGAGYTRDDKRPSEDNGPRSAGGEVADAIKPCRYDEFLEVG
jgi:hypothetical protein